MSRGLINEYRADLDRLRSVSGSRRESVLREAFKDLLKSWGRAYDLQFIPEHEFITPMKNRVYLDGALLHPLRVPFGYWEAKDADDDLDAEITAKTRKGYPRDNIIYSDDQTAVLIQDGNEIARVAMDDTDALYGLLTTFFAHERQEIADFNGAVKQFAQDLPAVLEALRALMATKRKASKPFAAAEKAFLSHAQDAINPAVTKEDVQEMLIQHILTEDIFAKVFDNPDFHRQNNVAAELYKSDEQKMLVAAEAMVPGAVVSQIARRWQICPSQVFTWRHLAQGPSRAACPRSRRRLCPSSIRRAFQRRQYPSYRVKGRHAKARDVIISKNEILASLNTPYSFFLALVRVEQGFANQPIYIQRFFQRELGFAETAIVFNLADLLSLAEKAA